MSVGKIFLANYVHLGSILKHNLRNHNISRAACSDTTSQLIVSVFQYLLLISAISHPNYMMNFLPSSKHCKLPLRFPVVFLLDSLLIEMLSPVQFSYQMSFHLSKTSNGESSTHSTYAQHS